MRVRLRSIRGSALAAGLVTGAVGFLLLWITGSGWLLSALGGLIMLMVGFIVSALLTRRIINYKLRPMYQFMQTKGARTAELRRSASGPPGIEDLKNWAETSRLEIARLKENEKYRKEYIGNVSHEIKTPIFNIQGYISTLLDGALEDETINRKYLERAEKSIDRLINIVTDLDEISKLESGVLVLHRERFDVVALAREAIEAVEMDAARKNIRLYIGEKSQQGPVYVYADKHYITQIFINLLTNSIRYGNTDGQTVITVTNLYEKVVVDISDNGVGIAEDDIPRVFERFYRTDKSRSREEGGTGLGLSIVKHIVEAHNESITLRSRLGKGSTFSFTLGKN